MFKAILFLLILSIIPIYVLESAEKTTCTKSFRFVGKTPDGQERTTTLAVTNRFYDFTPKQAAQTADLEKGKYEGADYKMVGNRTFKQDCAGYVMSQLWKNTGPYFVTAENLYNNVISVYGTKVSGWTGYGDVHAGDVVVFGNLGHVAIVKSVENGQVLIESKDGGESVFSHPLDSDANDPLNRTYGKPSIYRIDPGAIRMEEVTTGDCDKDICEDLSGDWQGQLKVDSVKNSSAIEEGQTRRVAGKNFQVVQEGCDVTLKFNDNQISGKADHKTAILKENAVGSLTSVTLTLDGALLTVEMTQSSGGAIIVSKGTLSH